jgi:5-methylcytosine-specific restriction protein A
MANRPLKPCSMPGCPDLTPSQYCSVHTGERSRRDILQRGTAQSRGYDYGWSQVSKRHLQQYPLCGMSAPNVYEGWAGECVEQGRITKADVTDHIRPHRGDRTLLLDPRNHRSLCFHCNRVKAIRYDSIGAQIPTRTPPPEHHDPA